MEKIANKKERNTYFDFLKGIAIMGVVAIHTMKFKYEPHTMEGVILVILRNLLGCCVPFFIAVSGYFLANKQISTKKEYFNFLKDRLKTVYIPMLFWGLPWISSILLSSQTLLGGCYVVLMYFIGGLSIFYFITLILELYIILPEIQKINVRWVIILSVISLIVTLWWSIIKYSNGVELPLVAYCSFPTYIGFFALGCYIGKSKIFPNLSFSIVIVIMGLILAVLESYYWLDFNPKSNWLGLKASVQFLSFGVIMLLFTKRFSSSYRSNKIAQIIEMFGVQSMPIYMSHMLVIFALRHLGFTSNIWIINLVVVFVLDVILIFILFKTLPRKYLQYVGIR